MSNELISKRTRDAFREHLVGWGTLRTIAEYFDNELINCDYSYAPPHSGQRRTLIEQYYTTLDFTNWEHVQKLLRVIEHVFLSATEQELEDTSKLVRFLENDGYKYENSQIISVSHPLLSVSLAVDALEQFNVKHMMQQIMRIESSIESDPDLAIGSAKELLESCCRTILDDRNVSIRKNANMPQLLEAVRNELRLLPEDIPDNTKGKQNIDLVLDGLLDVATGLNRLRNQYGTGHGKNGRVSSVKSRHAKLVVGASTTLVVFFYETHIETQVKSDD